jgi:hypothetical protein
MKKFALSLVAIAALSSAVVASGRTDKDDHIVKTPSIQTETQGFDALPVATDKAAAEQRRIDEQGDNN